MAKIRSVNTFKINIEGKVFRNQAWESDWFDGVIINIDDNSISTTAKTRRICKCGNVDDVHEETACPKCGNTNWRRGRLGRWRYSSDNGLACRTPRFIDDEIIGLNIKLTFDHHNKEFIMEEIRYPILENKGGFYISNDHTIDKNEFNALFNQYIADNPLWDNMRKLLSMYSVSEIQGWLGWIPESIADVKILLYNVYEAIPGIEYVSSELFRMILTHFVSTNFARYKSIENFYTSIGAPCALSNVYPILGIPKHCSLAKLDECSQELIDVVVHALLHNRITFNELDSIFYNRTGEEVNGYGYEFVDFFRRNVVKYGAKTFAAFEYIHGTGKDNIKEANLYRLDMYCRKKGVKTFPAAYDAIMNGDGLGFLAALAGETK